MLVHVGCEFIFEQCPEGSMAIGSNDFVQGCGIASRTGSSHKRRTLRSTTGELVALSLLLLGLLTTQVFAEGLNENQKGYTVRSALRLR